ncbi:MAG: hypothetical protein Q8J85_04830 [Sulfuricurvum sp.]|nr:hypothetical protein [Sulfuricurvum sp.]MDP3022367.1 hypothetical protein [Sulfuricurvum sp.]
MGYRLEVKNGCSCFKRDGGVDTQSFDSAQDVKEEAEALLQRMQKNYCKKHQFVLSSMGGNYTITIQPRVTG